VCAHAFNPAYRFADMQTLFVDDEYLVSPSERLL
jgi:hypothetical protein